MLCFIRVEVDKDYKDQTEQALDLATDYITEQGEFDQYTLAVLHLKSGVLECIADPATWGANRRRALPNWSTPDKLSAWLQKVIPTPKQCKLEISKVLKNIRRADRSWMFASNNGEPTPQIGNTLYTGSQKIVALESFQKSYQGPMDITDPQNEYNKMGFEESYVTDYLEVHVATDHLCPSSKPTHVVIMEVDIAGGR